MKSALFPLDSPVLQQDTHRAVLGSILSSITDSLLVLDANLHIVEANAQLLRSLGREREEIIGQCWAQVFPHLEGTGRREELQTVLDAGLPHRGRVPVVNGDGEAHLFDVSTYPVRDCQTEKVTHIVEFAREITEEVQMQLQVMDAHADLLRTKEQLEDKSAQIDAAKSLLEEKCRSLEIANRRLERLAVIDVMTDLPNHRAFQEHLAYQVKQTLRHHRPFSLIIFDVDNFKLYNDRHGHPEGDVLLATISSLLKNCVRAVDLPARYGGEEFAIILPETDRYGAAVVAERLRTTIASHQFRHGTVTISVGVAEFPADAEDGGGMVFCADKAMYHAKSNGKNTVSLWRGQGAAASFQGSKSQESLQELVMRCQSVPGLPVHLRQGSASGCRVLLVDQDFLSLGTLREALQGRGYAVSCAGTGQEALDALIGAAGGFDLMLTDIALPDKDGRELRTEARVLSPGLPVVFTSAFGNPAIIRQVLDQEDCEYLAKPFHSDQLANLIESVLAHRLLEQREELEPVGAC